MGEYQRKVSVLLVSVPFFSNLMRSSSVEAVSGEEESFYLTRKTGLRTLKVSWRERIMVF